MSARKLKLRIRFKTRTLLVCVVLVCAAAAWFGWRVRKGRRQYQSATAISEAGNIVLYRHYFDAKGTFITGPTPSPPHPEWVKKAFGELTFASVDRLTIGSRFSDNDAAHLPNLFTLEELDLSDRKVTDQAMKYIGKMKATGRRLRMRECRRSRGSGVLNHWTYRTLRSPTRAYST